MLKQVGQYQTALYLVSSNEHRTVVIQGYYQTFLGRSADAAGLSYWLAQCQNGLAIEQISVQFVSSDEYYRNNGNNDTAFIQSLYKRFLNRDADSDGLSYWKQQLSSGKTRTEVATGFVTSDEYRANLVKAWYAQYLHRAADSGGITYWVGQLRSGALNLETMQASMIASPEYHAALPTTGTGQIIVP